MALQKKPSAACVDALRWRVMFTDFAAAIVQHDGIDYNNKPEHYKVLVREAGILADLGLKEFYSRYEKEVL